MTGAQAGLQHGEVETRIVKPYRSLAAQQILRRARQLLLAPADALPAG